MRKAEFSLFCWMLLAAILCALPGCGQQEKELLVYSGKGLKEAVAELAQAFEEKYQVKVNVVYGGSQTMLATIQTTQQGDIFIPGGMRYIEEAGDLVTSHKIVAEHSANVVVRADNTKGIHSFQDLTRPGITLAIGNKDVCAIGVTTEKMFQQTGEPAAFFKNVTMKGATANELLDLVIQGEVDAAITHAHLLQLARAKGLRAIDIPPFLRGTLKVPVGLLRTSENRRLAELFSEFAATEGRKIFEKHGFGG